jgi:hypothetical protein
MDVMGQQALLRGWSLVLAGRESEVPSILGTREDAICAAADTPVEEEAEFKLGQKQLKGRSMFVFGLRFAWDLLWNQVIETRTICFSKTAMARLRSQAQSELASQNSGTEKPFISEGDVLTAWAARTVASSLPQPRPISIVHALNARFRLPSLIQASGVYVQNMAVAAFTFLSSDIATGPVGPIAMENRRHLMEQSTEAQVLAFIRNLRQKPNLDSDPALVLCGDSEALLMPFTNWTRAEFFKVVDFSAAVVRAGETASRANPPGSIIFHHVQSMRQGPTVRNVFVVLGKDHTDNYWVTGILLPKAWRKIEEDFEKI